MTSTTRSGDVSLQSSLSTAKDKLITFLSSHSIIVSSHYNSSSSSSSSTTTTTSTTIQDILRSIFHLLDESLIKSLVNQAIEERNHNLSNNNNNNNSSSSSIVLDHELLGSYGIIIDCMKEVIMEYQDKCGSTMQQLVALGLRSSSSSRPPTAALDEYITQLYHRHEINYLLRDLIASSIITYSNGGGNVRLLNTLKHIHEVFQKHQYTIMKGSDASSSTSSSLSSLSSSSLSSLSSSSLSSSSSSSSSPLSSSASSSNISSSSSTTKVAPPFHTTNNSTTTTTTTAASATTTAASASATTTAAQVMKKNAPATVSPPPISTSSSSSSSSYSSATTTTAAVSISSIGVAAVSTSPSSSVSSTDVPPPPPLISISHEKANDDDFDDDDDDHDRDDDDVLLNEDGLIRAGQLLQSILTTCVGDANRLKAILIEKCANGEIGDRDDNDGDDNGDDNNDDGDGDDGACNCCFKQVLRDNIDACKANNYKNKQMILEFALKVVVNEMDELRQKKRRRRRQMKSSDGNGGDGDGDGGVKKLPCNDDEVGMRMMTTTSTTATTHAPQFVDDSSQRSGHHEHEHQYILNSDHIEVTLLPDIEGEFIHARDYISSLSSSSSSSNKTTTKKINTNNKKNKSLKNGIKRSKSRLAMHATTHLEQHGWVVLDGFISDDVIKRVRIESNLFRNVYEQSEIWVGKHADVGAQLSVPSVRGDRVLWMCGGHTTAAPEGVTRHVRTIGEIEPCRLEVKAKAPIRKFAAMKELIAECDGLIEDMKTHSSGLKDIYERSDVMLACYPGEGSRFAKHIDNTTGDGRKLTLLVYLNPGWQSSDGGALRLFPKKNNNLAPGKGVAGGSNVAVDIMPVAGRLALFYSADVAHEVLPTFGDRHALTIWYYDKVERKRAIDKAHAGGHNKKVATSTVESQQQAKAFISALMGGDDVTEDGGDPTADELSSLAVKVHQLDNEVLDIVASITGAPSVDSFRAGFPLLTVGDLKSMRALFRRMGLGSYSTV